MKHLLVLQLVRKEVIKPKKMIKNQRKIKAKKNLKMILKRVKKTRKRGKIKMTAHQVQRF
jgi:hypothetical protein